MPTKALINLTQNVLVIKTRAANSVVFLSSLSSTLPFLRVQVEHFHFCEFKLEFESSENLSSSFELRKKNDHFEHVQ